MKKSFTLLSVMLAGSMAFAQSQRLCLLEEFTQASCPPCAAQNPALNALLASNTTKVVSIKYQTSWPGVDPMNAQNPSEVATRVSYYGVNGVPNIEFDGNVLSNAAPSALNQTNINNQYAVPSPFTITMNHTFNTDYTVATVNITVTATQDVSGTLKLHLAAVEKEIKFTSAPGTNGEKEFYSVMRKMYPNASGTDLAGSWTVGQTQTFNITANIPTYIYDKNQLAFVAFIQDNTDKNVKQAAISEPQPLMNDAAMTAIGAVPVFQCSNSFTPTVTIKNSGSSTMSSCIVNYQIDNGPVSQSPWNGSLAPGATAVKTLPAVTATPGGHVFKSFCTQPNGSPDYNPGNDAQQVPFSIVNPVGTLTPITETYHLTAFPPAEWFIVNPDNGPTWSRKTNAGANGTTSCAKMDIYNSTSGNVDELFMPNVDLTTTLTNATLKFSVAYCQYQNEADKLEVKVSKDCGATWTTVFNKSGSTLATAAAQTAAFTPTASQWREEVVDMTQFINSTDLLIKFQATSAYGNNMYIDEINLTTQSVSVEEELLNASTISLYPNPTSDVLNVNISLINDATVNMSIVNALGQNVRAISGEKFAAGNAIKSIDISDLATGVYSLRIATEGKIVTKQFIKK
jgi:hypothetical protein